MTGQESHTETCEQLGDRELLRRFSLDSDEAAFAEIVRRYERLVMSVCRRVIGGVSEADDAFQATFITLARKPRQIRKIESLSSWLYSVAWRISVRLVRARRKNPVQPIPEEQSTPAKDPLQKIAAHQDAVILDEELQTLPSKYRDVLVMTYFAEQTSQQIADQLDVSKGTVDGRIRQARNILRVKLARRGVGIGALLTAATLLNAETAAASPALVSSTIELGAQTLSQTLPTSADVSHIEPLVRPEITSMIGTKSLISAVVGIVALAGVAGMGSGQSKVGNTTAADGANGAKVEAKTLVESEPVSTVELTAAELPPLSDSVSVAVASTTASSKTGASSGKTMAFSYYPEDARPTERWLYETLDQPIPAIRYNAGTELSEILDQLAQYFSDNSEGQVLRVWFDRRSMEDDGIEVADLKTSRDIKLANVTLNSALSLVFNSIGALT